MVSKKAVFNVGLNLLLIVILLIVLLIAGYFLYINIPGKPENIQLEIRESTKTTNQTFKQAGQFYPNMKFNHNAISYKIDPTCTQEKKQRILEALNELSNLVEIISFSSTSSNPDIEVSCSEQEKPTEKDYFIAGEGGAKEIIQTKKYNVITQGIVLLHDGANGIYKCDWANIELHELIHVFGFDHTENPNSLMYPYLGSCDQGLDNSIITELKRLYSEKNLPDLYFEEIVATKKGRYLDFNLTIKNSGTINAQAASFSVLDDGKLVDTFNLEDLKYGAGISIQIKNLKLIHRDPKKIKFIIDRDDAIEELDEENNIVMTEF